MPKFFINTDQKQEKKIYIQGEDVNHIKNVLRKKIGDELIICDKDKSQDYSCTIQKINDNLYINPDFFKAKLVLSRVKAGFAGIMDDKIEKRISFDEILKINEPSTFVFKVSGDSMCDIGIFDNDYVIIKKQQNAKEGDIVLAIVDNEFTLKTLKKDEKGMYLKPENKNYPPIRPKFSLTIFGIAIGITRKLI